MKIKNFPPSETPGGPENLSEERTAKLEISLKNVSTTPPHVKRKGDEKNSFAGEGKLLHVESCVDKLSSYSCLVIFKS